MPFNSIEKRRHSPGQPWTYALLDQRQREIARDILENDAPGKLLLSEVAPVITLGRRTPETDLTLPKQTLQDLGVETHRTDRGGLATYHGPGQWVLFAVDRLDRLTGDSRGVRHAVEGLLEIARVVGESMGVGPCETRSGAETGVWTREGKFAAVGVHIENRILLHGLAVNGFRTPLSFTGLRPCGLDAPVSFLLDHEKGFEELGDALSQAAIKRFWHRS